ncbi:glutathione S-transferase [Lactarius akahatsu]|uniref:Glutathione S-transferase n=1 Tax=Lactarius akahatsu TaxID=416441 RepID=A0AAD4Q7Y2_9AGAM|nr:glutathione S-transferase [Lactarius akahatsu]
MTTPDIIFYTAKVRHGLPVCSAEIAFQEAKADVTRYWIDVANKPEWFAARVNPVGQVPALVYGSPKSDPENPSPGSAKIAESVVLLEFVADLYPDSGLLPKDPVERARVRFFIDAVSTKVFPPFFAFLYRGESPDAFIAAAAEIQELLPPTAQFAVGDHFTIADAALAPFLGRSELYFRNDFGRYGEGAGPPVYEELFRSERFERLQKYFANISSRESFKNSFDTEYLIARAKTRFARH